MDDLNENQVGELYVVGTRGYSAYEVAVQNGFEGTVDEWLESLKGETGDRGPQGEQGIQGVPGPAPSLRVGSVTTGEAGTNVEVSITGTPQVPLINFTIPKGDKGDKGDPGVTPDLTDYYTKSEVDDLIPTVPTNVSSFTNDANYTNKTYVDNAIPTKVSSLENDMKYLTNDAQATTSGNNIILNNSYGQNITFDFGTQEVTQSGTPSPSSPILPNTISGNNSIVISNADNTPSQNYSINLGSIEYCEMDDEKDKIYRDDKGDWYFEEHIRKRVLTGTNEDWLFSSYTNDTIYSVFARIGGKNASRYITNSFPYKAVVNSSTTEEYCSTNGEAIRIGILKSRLSDETIAGFKAWVGQNNIKAYYKRNTPETTKITDTSLGVQLENLYQNAVACNGITTISQINTDLPFVLSVRNKIELEDYATKEYVNDKIQGGGGSSTTIYEISYDAQSGNFSGTIDTNLTADDLLNSIFKTEYDFVDEQTIHLTALCRVVKCLFPEGADEIYISILYPNDYSVADILYTPSTGLISNPQ